MQVNYCISCGLGIGGTVHRHSFADAMEDAGLHEFFPIGENSDPRVLAVRGQAIRGPLWFACGLAGAGILVAAIFCLRTYTWGRKKTTG